MASLLYPLQLVHALIREHVTKPSTRSDQWPTFRKHILQKVPKCQACGAASLLQVHHIAPFHDHPELELTPSNVIVLCMTPELCHLQIGHGGFFKTFNPNVVADAAAHLKADTAGRKRIVAQVKAERIPD